MMAVVSSHVLDARDGSHAGGVGVTLKSLATGAFLFRGQTDADGRLTARVGLSGAAPDAGYELVLASGAYWRARGLAGGHPIKEVVLRFTMPAPDKRYHMPVILSPNGYSTWASEPE